MNATANRVPSIFESFNARFLSPEEVARTFVKSEHFEQLCKPCHSIIVGPRGSGKTTLLMMLQGRALSAWGDSEAPHFRSLVNYTGVFVPTDIAWTKQIQQLGKGYLSSNHCELIARAVFTTHILHKLVLAIEDRLIFPQRKSGAQIHRGIQCSSEQEVLLTKSLADSWYLKLDILSLLALKQSITRRIGQIYEFASKERFLDDQGRNERFAAIPYLHIDFLQCTTQAIEVFGDTFGNKDQRWALLFDELELAPKYFVQYLYDALRSSDKRILFKLSLSPFNEHIGLLDNVLEAMPGHDFEFVRLWYPNKEEAKAFSTALVDSLLSQRNIKAVSLTEIIGHTLPNEWGESRQKSAYRADQRRAKILKKLYHNDKSFREYIIRKKIDLENLDALNESQRAQSVRKLYPIVLVRNFYRAPDDIRHIGEKARRRSRKTYPTFYAGAKAILEILEGNPRWIIGVIGPLLDRYLQTGRRISITDQIEQIRKATNQFNSLLAALPCDVSAKGQPPRSIMSIIDTIGVYFSKGVIVDRFQAEPAGSFTVDRTTTREFEKSLAAALNAGAIVYVPGATSRLILKSLIDRRFRICYLLAPKYRLPIQLMREVPLRSVLSRDTSTTLPLFQQDAGDTSDD